MKYMFHARFVFFILGALESCRRIGAKAPTRKAFTPLCAGWNPALPGGDYFSIILNRQWTHNTG